MPRLHSDASAPGEDVVEVQRALMGHRVDDLGIEVAGCPMDRFGEAGIHSYRIKNFTDEAAVSTLQSAHAIDLDAITACRDLGLCE